MNEAQWFALPVFGGFGLMMLWVGVREWRLQDRLLAGARPVEATIVHAAVRSHRSADTDPSLQRNTSTTTHTPDLRFRVRVGDREFESDRLRPSAIARSHGSREAAQREIEGLVPGTRVQAWVDPRHPELAFLRAERSAGPKIFVAVGLAVPPLAWALAGLAG